MMAPLSRTDGAGESVKVWDPLVRVFHWSLVCLFVFSFVTGDEWKKAHILSGYAIAGLIALRLVWGLVGSHHARFANFLYAPTTLLAFLRDSFALRAKRYLGHNPAGGAMVVLLLVAVSGIVTTGYMMTTDAYWGVAWVEDTHKVLVYSTMGLVALHIAGVVLASVEHRENLVRAMVTGRKRREG
ncbi:MULTISPECIES: cytochrome b/b6 domain-containing protein [unclassified Shinella]|jgi:cytochrome b|uniref:cytochrome b/b6 domain-containing protein n=2 Tax=unclassified Shinella TaxID=2643062 RepID=UPI0003F4B7E9